MAWEAVTSWGGQRGSDSPGRADKSQGQGQSFRLLCPGSATEGHRGKRRSGRLCSLEKIQSKTSKPGAE